MRIGEGVEWALHCVAVVAALPPGWTIPGSKLAELHELGPTYLAKHLQGLTRAGILESVPGPRGGYRLARPADAITVADVVDAVQGAGPAFRCREIRRQGPCAGPKSHYRHRCTIDAIMLDAESAWRASLDAVTIAELNKRTVRAVHPDTIDKLAKWLPEAARQPPQEAR
jgi:Rrf2 family protein